MALGSEQSSVPGVGGCDEGPVTVHFCLIPQFLIGSTLTDTCDEQWANMTKQTARGQELAMSIYCNDFDNQKRNQTVFVVH